MAYDASKLVKLGHLKTVATKVDGEIDALAARVDGIASAGGEPNVLTGVKVNGTALTIANKMVDVLITTGTSNGTIKVNNADVAVKGLAALAYKANVSESELSEALKTSINAKASNADLTALSNRVGSIPTGAKSTNIVDYVAEKIAEIVAGADESLDTLKEIADWISGHASDAATMNSNITAVTKLVGTLPKGATSTTVVGYIAEAIAAIGIGDYAKTAEVNTILEGYVKKVTGSRLMTDAEGTKLAGIAEGANKTTVDTAISGSSSNPVANSAVSAALGNKVDKVSGKGLSTNDYTTAEKDKLAGIAEGANKTVVDTSLNSSSDNPVANKIVTTAVSSKVDKVEGKGLSTNDYTTAEKTKLSGLNVATDDEVTEMLNEVFGA